MPDVLVISSLVPKAFGAKVILDMEDPMPELMQTIFGSTKNSLIVRLLMRTERWSFGRANLVITTNEAFKQAFASRSCRADKISVVMNSPDETIFLPGLGLQAPREKARGAKLIIMYHGTLVQRHGLDLATKALAEVREQIPTARLRIYGRRTSFLDRVMHDAQQHGLCDFVQYLGPRRLEDIVGAILDCDVGIIPNHYNPFTDINMPTRIFEFLVLGKPVIAPRTRGIRDYFDAKSLVLFEAGDPYDLAQKIVYVATHPREVSVIVDLGQRVQRKHSWSQERQRLIEVVSRLLMKG